MKDELGKGYMTEFVALSPQVYAYKQSRLDNSLSEHKKAKVQKKKKKKLLKKRDYGLIFKKSVYSRIKRLTAYNIG